MSCYNGDCKHRKECQSVKQLENIHNWANELKERLNHVVNVVCKDVERHGDFPVDDIDYLRECNSRLGISTPDTYEEGW